MLLRSHLQTRLHQNPRNRYFEPPHLCLRYSVIYIITKLNSSRSDIGIQVIAIQIIITNSFTDFT